MRRIVRLMIKAPKVPGARQMTTPAALLKGIYSLGRHFSSSRVKPQRQIEDIWRQQNASDLRVG